MEQSGKTAWKEWHLIQFLMDLWGHQHSRKKQYQTKRRKAADTFNLKHFLDILANSHECLPTADKDHVSLTTRLPLHPTKVISQYLSPSLCSIFQLNLWHTFTSVWFKSWSQTGTGGFEQLNWHVSMLTLKYLHVTNLSKVNKLEGYIQNLGGKQGQSSQDRDGTSLRTRKTSLCFWNLLPN